MQTNGTLRYLRLNPREVGNLIAILKHHLEDGVYWGNKEQHYKSVSSLIAKLEHYLNED